MMNRLMITAATAALIAGTGLANAQGVGGREGGAAGGAGMQQSAPSAPAASPSAGAPSREGSSEGMKATQSEEKGGMKNQRAQQDMKSGPAGEKSMGEKSAQDTKQDTKADHSKGMTQNEKGAAGANGPVLPDFLKEVICAIFGCERCETRASPNVLLEPRC